MSSDRIPALVVAGFLGSGKTSLVRHLLEHATRSGVRLAVISNEFGALGIDQALLGGGSEIFVELEGGCVCCKLSDELIETLQRLHEQVEPDAIVVEASGVALPADIQLSFWREPVAEWVADDVAVVVVNAEQLHQGRDLDATFEAQVSSADLLLLNQIDRVPAGTLEGLEVRLREIEPDAPLLRSVHAAVDPDLLFPPDPQGLRERRRRRATGPAPHTHTEFKAREIQLEPGITPERLCEELRRTGALRVKGFVETSEGPRLVQGVGPRIELSTLDRPPPSGLLGRLVLIIRPD
ncbi:MAG: CobW family GTP-binding protein [Myxococcota bacterium]